MLPGIKDPVNTPLNDLVQNSKTSQGSFSSSPRSFIVSDSSLSSSLPRTIQFSYGLDISCKKSPVVVVVLASKDRGPEPLISTAASSVLRHPRITIPVIADPAAVHQPHKFRSYTPAGQ